MFAIVSIAGQQFKITEGQELYVHNLNAQDGEKITFDDVLLINRDSKTTVGSPLIKNASVGATVVESLKGDKVVVFKKKRRKGYKVKNGHRQQFTKIKIDSIKA